MKSTLIAMILVSLAGCDLPRNKPEDTAKDFAICQAAGMGAGKNTYGEIRCLPPTQVKK